jgi:hypothetical protein
MAQEKPKRVGGELLTIMGFCPQKIDFFSLISCNSVQRYTILCSVARSVWLTSDYDNLKVREHSEKLGRLDGVVVYFRATVCECAKCMGLRNISHLCRLPAPTEVTAGTSYYRFSPYYYLESVDTNISPNPLLFRSVR